MTSGPTVEIRRGNLDRAEREIRRTIRSMRGPNSVKVGLPRGSNAYPDGTSVIAVGLVHEFGSPQKGIPERSYMRSTLNEKNRDIKELFKKISKKIIRGELTKEEALELVGLQLQTDIREKITDIDTPELKSRDGNPLVDSGHLRQSITYVVGDTDAD